MVACVVALGAVVLALKGSSSSSADEKVVPTTTVAANVTTTTIDPKAIQAGVANLLAHEGATPQQIAAVPANTSHNTGGGTHHAKGGTGSHTKH